MALRKFVMTAAMLGLSLTAHADILAGVGWVVFPEFGSPPAIVYDSCGTSIASGTVCAIVANIPSGGGNACRIVLSPSGAGVRGKLEIRDASGEILSGLELR